MTTYHLCGSFTKGVTADDVRYYTDNEHHNAPSVWLVYRGHYSRWRKIPYRQWAWQLSTCAARLQRALWHMMEDTIQGGEHDNLPSAWLVYRGRYGVWWKILYKRMSMTSYHLCGSFTKGVTADDGRYYTRLRAWQLTICMARLQRALQQMTEDAIQRMSTTTYHLCRLQRALQQMTEDTLQRMSITTYHLCRSFTEGVMAYDGRYYTRGWAWRLTICVARLQRASQQMTEDTIPDYEHDNLPSVWLVYRGHYSRWRKILYRGWAWQLTICVARSQRALQQMMDDTIQRMSMTTYHLCGSFTEGVTAEDGRYYTEDEHDNGQCHQGTIEGIASSEVLKQRQYVSF